MQAIICTDAVQNICMGSPVSVSLNTRLKNLRISAVPKLSIRRMAEELGIGYSRYAYFEDPKRFKKGELPLDLTRKIAEVLARYGVDPAEVMNLAGLRDQEAMPEVRAIETARPAVQFVPFPVALPSEDALANMFESLLALIPGGATRAEAARILAQRLPSGFLGIGPFSVVQDNLRGVSATEPLFPATDHPAPLQPSHT